jgi:hypothetical protein
MAQPPLLCDVIDIKESISTSDFVLSLTFCRNPDGTTTGRNEDMGFTVTLADDEEVKQRLYEDAGWKYTPPPPPAPPGYHRFSLVHDEFAGAGFEDGRYAGLRSHPPEGCQPEDWGCFALTCERPKKTLLDAVTSTVAKIRREHGLVMNSMGIEKPQEWLGNDKNGYAAQIGGHLLLLAAHRASLLGYRRKDLIRLLDATGVE